MIIVSGHQRVKAAKDLGIELVPVRIREDLIDEDKKLKVLLVANFQRPKNSEAKQRKVVDEYVRLCGYKNGEIGNRREKDSQNGKAKLTLEEIAKQLGTSKSNLTRALRIERNLTDSMKELLDDGIITKTLASDTIASLSEDKQEELFKKLDITQKITKREVQHYIDRIKQLEAVIQFISILYCRTINPYVNRVSGLFRRICVVSCKFIIALPAIEELKLFHIHL